MTFPTLCYTFSKPSKDTTSKPPDYQRKKDLDVLRIFPKKRDDLHSNSQHKIARAFPVLGIDIVELSLPRHFEEAA